MNVTITIVNEEIWDLLSGKNSLVDLVFQCVQLIHGLSSRTVLADQLFKDFQSMKTVNVRETLTHVTDSIAIFDHANWRFNMKRREVIKYDLNPPYTVWSERVESVHLSQGTYQFTANLALPSQNYKH